MMRSDSTGSSKSGLGFGRQGEKAAAAQGMFRRFALCSRILNFTLAGFHIREPEESVPPYAPKPREPKRATSPGI